jgi:hypothetical protein|tara:strand:+ start:756 stop:2471 length:1716 start_codon:yes stop_codon:yes gene_type:complete
MARVILQQAPTGLDTFLEEISKYASPEYQLRKRESERADARLELSRRQQEESDLRYRDSVRQQRFQNNLAEGKFNLEKNKFEQDTFRDNYNIAKGEIDQVLALSYSDSKSLADMNVESVLANVSDEKVKARLKPYLQSRKEFGARQEQNATEFMDRYNSRNPNNIMDISDARRFISDDQAYRGFLNDSYIKDKPDITPSDARALTYFVNTIGRIEKKRNDLQEKFFMMDAKKEAESYNQAKKDLEKYDADIAKFELQAAQIVGRGQRSQDGRIEQQGFVPDVFQEGSTQDGSADFLASAFPTLSLVQQMSTTPVPFRDDDYDIAFSSEDEATDTIVEDAVDTAVNNASGDNVENVSLLSGRDIDRYDPTSEELDESSAVPPAFLQRAGEGMAQAEAKTLRPDTTPPSAGAEMAGDVPADVGEILEMFGQEDLSNLPTVPSRPGTPKIRVNYAPISPSGLIKIRQGEDKGDSINVQQLSSRISNSLKKLDSAKKTYRATDSEKETNKKGILARRIASEQKKMIDLLQPYLLESGDFRDNFFNQRFYDLLSKRTKIPVNELKGLILSNMEYNI